MKRFRGRNKAFTSFYGLWIAPLRTLARRHGYALAPHGSMRRDLDLIAVAWTHDAVDPRQLIRAIADRVGACHVSAMERKPHGRAAWSIHMLGGMYLDVSVIGPREWREPKLSASSRLKTIRRRAALAAKGGE